MLVMQEEVFGPLLPILTYRSLDDALRYVNDHPRPLALYYFDLDQSRVRHVLTRGELETWRQRCLSERLSAIFPSLRSWLPSWKLNRPDSSWSRSDDRLHGVGRSLRALGVRPDSELDWLTERSMMPGSFGD